MFFLLCSFFSRRFFSRTANLSSGVDQIAAYLYADCVVCRSMNAAVQSKTNHKNLSVDHESETEIIL